MIHMIPGRLSRRHLSDGIFFGFIAAVLVLCSCVTAAMRIGQSTSAPAYRFIVMNGFSYRPSRQLLFKAEFFKEFPATATQAKNLVWDTFMLETFAQQQT